MAEAFRAVEPGQDGVGTAFDLMGDSNVQTGDIAKGFNLAVFRHCFSCDADAVTAGQGKIPLTDFILISIEGIGSGKFQGFAELLCSDLVSGFWASRFIAILGQEGFPSPIPESQWARLRQADFLQLLPV